MTELWTSGGQYRVTEYENEAELETAILQLQDRLFGPNRIYLDVKRKIGRRGGQRNIPDGYLIDLQGSRPQLYVVENELERHDPLRHIAVQVLEFSLSFESDPLLVKSILLDALDEAPDHLAHCQRYIGDHPDFRNVDHLLESLVVDSGFRALVIIDNIPDRLETVLLERFKFPVEVMYLTPYESDADEQAYRYEPFLAGVLPPASATGMSERQLIDPQEIDTIVVPARADGFHQTFLGEQRWYAIRMHASMRSQIQWIAAYQVAPISAVTHVAPVKSIEPWGNSGKVVVNFGEPAREIDHIGIVGDARAAGLQAPRYTSKSRLDAASSIPDLW